MKTADLILALAGGATATRPRAVTQRLVSAASLGALAAFVLLVSWLGTRPLADAVRSPSFWMKGGYTLCLALAGLLLVDRLARPTGKLGGGAMIILVAATTMAVLAGLEVMRTPRSGLAAVWLGDTWAQCPFRIMALSLPIYLGVALTMRRLAPTRLLMAGAAAGLLAGAVGATIYGLYCEETTAAFTATWYTLGIAACAAVGGLLGPRLLRW